MVGLTGVCPQGEKVVGERPLPVKSESGVRDSDNSTYSYDPPIVHLFFVSTCVTLRCHRPPDTLESRPVVDPSVTVGTVWGTVDGSPMHVRTGTFPPPVSVSSVVEAREMTLRRGDN